MKNGRFIELYEIITKDEKETKDLLIQLEADYPGTAKEANIDDIAGNLREKANKAAILAQLTERKKRP